MLSNLPAHNVVELFIVCYKVLNNLTKRTYETLYKKENMTVVTSIFTCYPNVSNLPKNEFQFFFLPKFLFLSANTFDLDKTQTFSCGKDELILYK